MLSRFQKKPGTKSGINAICPGKPWFPNTATAFPRANQGLLFFLSSEKHIYILNLNTDNGTVGCQLTAHLLRFLLEFNQNLSLQIWQQHECLKLHNHFISNWKYQIRNVFGKSQKPNKKAPVLHKQSWLCLFKKTFQQRQNNWLAI